MTSPAHPAASPAPALDEAQARALALLRAGSAFVLAGHVRPDGDCIGAQAALARTLERLGKRVSIVNPDPPEARYAYLASECAYATYAGGELPAHDVAVLLDASELERCGALGDALRAAPSKKLVVDHHVQHGRPWWDAAFVDVSAAATGLLVRRIARALGVELDRVAAEGVFTSLVTDTGWFKYSNTDRETLATAAELVAAGVDPAALYRAIYQQKSAAHPLGIARLLERVEYHAGGRLALVTLPLALGAPPEAVDTDEVLDILRSVGAVEVVLLLRETPEGAIKLSARSKTDYDVNALARAFGGGGHVKASGATLQGTLDEARARLLPVAVAGFPAAADGRRPPR
jgi:phosphoesterase RecJ-like protein